MVEEEKEKVVAKVNIKQKRLFLSGLRKPRLGKSMKLREVKCVWIGQRV